MNETYIDKNKKFKNVMDNTIDTLLKEFIQYRNEECSEIHFRSNMKKVNECFKDLMFFLMNDQ